MLIYNPTVTVVGRQGSGLDKLRALGVSVEVEGRSGANTGEPLVTNVDAMY